MNVIYLLRDFVQRKNGLKKEHKSLILDKFSKDHKFEELFIKLQKLEKIYMGIGIRNEGKESLSTCN